MEAASYCEMIGKKLGVSNRYSGQREKAPKEDSDRNFPSLS